MSGKPIPDTPASVSSRIYDANMRHHKQVIEQQAATQKEATSAQNTLAKKIAAEIVHLQSSAANPRSPAFDLTSISPPQLVTSPPATAANPSSVSTVSPDLNVVIDVYPPYNKHRYSTPWAAICDSAGQPNFKEHVSHFVGSAETGGTLYVEGPSEGSIWLYGQKDYKAPSPIKQYVQFRGGTFHPLHPNEVLTALASAPHPLSEQARRKELLHILFHALFACQHHGQVPDLEKIMDENHIIPEELETYSNLRFFGEEE